MDTRHDRNRFALCVGRGLLYTVPFLIGFLCARPAAGQWPVREFEVVSLEDFGAQGETLTTLFNAVSGQVDEWLVAWGLDPAGARLYVPHPETKREIEAYLTEAADVIASWGFPSPRLAARNGRYQVILAAAAPGAHDDPAAGTYHPSICGIIGGRIFLRASAILRDNTAGAEGSPRLTPFGREVLGHELFHAVQYNTPFINSTCLSRAGSWIVEGTADAVGIDVLRISRGEELEDWGNRDYSRRLPVPFVYDPFSSPSPAAYGTSSFWRYLAEYYALGGSGQLPGPESPGDRVDYGYLATMLSRGSAAGCVGRDAPCDDELRWLNVGLRSIFGRGLADLYPLFAETLALYYDHRPMLGGALAWPWHDDVFNGCTRAELTPTSRERRLVIPGFEPVSIDCWQISVVPFKTDTFVKVTVQGPPGGLSLNDISLSVSGLPVQVEARQETREPDRWLVSWVVKLPHDRDNYLLLTNVADDPAASTRMINLPITFTAFDSAAVVSFDGSVSGLDPFNFNPSGEGRHEVSGDRLRFGVNGVRTDVAACLVMLNLPTDDGDLVSVGGSLPLPLAVGEFPIEPPTFTVAGPAPVGVLDGQVFRSGGAWRTSAYRGTFRISAISRTHVSGGFDMVAVDQPVRASASFVAPLGAPPGGLSPGHPCTPAEPDAVGQPASGGGGGSAPPTLSGGEPGPTPAAAPTPGATGSGGGTETGAGPGSAPGAVGSTQPIADPRRGAAPAPGNRGFEIPDESLVVTRRLGTIEGIVDGQLRTWYVVEAVTDTGRYASGRWTGQGAGRLTLVVEGFETDLLPVNSFQTRTEPPSYGPYQRGVIRLTVPVAGDRGARRFDLPGVEAGAAVYYSPTTADGSYRAVDGVVNVEWAASPDGTIRLEGHFEGVFQAPNGDRRIRIEDGRIDVEGIPPDALLRR